MLKMASATVQRAIFGVGLVATGRALVRHLRRSDPEAHVRAPRPTGPHPFDLEFGVDTGGFVSWRDLQAGGANDPYISGYLGIAPSLARHVVGLIENPAQYSFIDLGCGKGRAAIIASERPFRRVIGVEIAAGLAELARANAAKIREAYPDRIAIEIVQADAALMVMPADPLALFLYQPFERPVMRQVLARLVASLAAKPRPVLIIYVYPVLAGMLDAQPGLVRLTEGFWDPTEQERPFSYGGRGGRENYVVWGTRDPSPVVLGA